MAFGMYSDDDYHDMNMATHMAAQDALGFSDIRDSITDDSDYGEPCACEFGSDMCGYCEDRHMAAWYSADTEADALAIIA